MARYKHIKPTFEDPKLNLSKKHNRYRLLLVCIFAVIELTVCVIMACFQQNRFAVGGGAVLLGLVMLGFAILYDHSISQDYGPFMWYDEFEDVKNHIPKKQREQDREKHDFQHNLVCFLCVSLATVLILLGILRLCQVI